MNKIVLIFLGFILALGLYLGTSSKYKGVPVNGKNLQGNKVEIMGRNHVSENTEVKYNSNPPTSGPHSEISANWGIYEEPIKDSRAVHALEHGGIWITYKNLPKEDIDKLKNLADKHPTSSILSPREENDSNIAVVSWGRIMKFDKLTEEVLSKIELFINSNINNSPERMAIP